MIRIALEELGLTFEPVRVDRAAAAHKKPDYLKLNPQGLLPVLEDGDLVLFETGAILLHLADHTGRLGPEGPDAQDRQARAAFLKWLFYLSNTAPRESEAEKRFRFRVVDPNSRGWRTRGMMDAADAALWGELGALWQNACIGPDGGRSIVREGDDPFPLDEHELPGQAMSLTPAQCGALVRDAQEGEAAEDRDWVALEGLCRAIES